MATSHLVLQPEISVQERIVAAGKHLYHVVGYDGVSIEAICREAKATELDFVIHFGRKESLLQAIFEEGWHSLLSGLPRAQAVVSARERLKELLRLAVDFFMQDPVFSGLFVFEGHRLRDREMMMLTPSYTDFVALIDSLVQVEAPEEECHVVRSGLMGACEGLVRDLAWSKRFGYPADFSWQQAGQMISRLVDSLLQPA